MGLSTNPKTLMRIEKTAAEENESVYYSPFEPQIYKLGCKLVAFSDRLRGARPTDLPLQKVGSTVLKVSIFYALTRYVKSVSRLCDDDVWRPLHFTLVPRLACDGLAYLLYG